MPKTKAVIKQKLKISKAGSKASEAIDFLLTKSAVML